MEGGCSMSDTVSTVMDFKNSSSFDDKSFRFRETPEKREVAEAIAGI
jgi:hypothetical protein